MTFESDGVNRRYEMPSSQALQYWDSVPNAFLRARPASTHTPESELQALMEAIPHSEPSQSADQQTPLREAVSAVVDLLPRKERLIIEALFYEQDVSLRELAYRVGMPRTSVSRLRDRALLTLQDLMSRNQTIQEKLGMQATSWDEAARDALLEITETTYYVEQYISEVSDAVDAAYDHWSRIRRAAMWEEFANAGRVAWTWLINYHQGNEAHLFEDMIRLLVERQAKYGHANIMKFQDLGLCVRLSDKAARLVNLEESGGTFDDESVVDTWMDIVGYSVISRMLTNATFEYELEEAGDHNQQSDIGS